MSEWWGKPTTAVPKDRTTTRVVALGNPDDYWPLGWRWELDHWRLVPKPRLDEMERGSTGR